ncbi:MAG: hypothetical protein AAF614_36145 [Chloroflexota bacterium]
MQVARQRKRPLLIPLTTYLEALANVATDTDLAPLLTLARTLWELIAHSQASGLWARDQGWRFAMAEQAAYLEMVVAMVEMGDRGCYQTFMDDALPDGLQRQRPFCDYALGWFGGQIAAAIRQLAYQSGFPLSDGLASVEKKLGDVARQARTTIQNDLEYLTE